MPSFPEYIILATITTIITLIEREEMRLEVD